MSRREFELEWDRSKQYLFKSIFTEGPALSPIPEYPLKNPGGEVLTRDRDPSPPPPLIIERVPRRRDDDEPEEFYIKLERKLIKYYKKLFNIQNDDSIATELDEEIYGYNPFDLSDADDLNRAFISDVSLSNECLRVDDQFERENSSSYEDIDEEIEDDQIRQSRVVASTYIDNDGDKRESNNEVHEERQGLDDSDDESAHSLILCSNVTRRLQDDRRESRDADTLQNLRVDEDWSVSSFQLEAERRTRETHDDDKEADVEDETLDINNNKTLEDFDEDNLDEEDNSDHYETIDIEEVHIGDVEMRRKEITPQISPIVTSDRSLSPIVTFTTPLDLCTQSIEQRLSQKDQSIIENQYYKVSLNPRTSTPRKHSRKRSGDHLDTIPAKYRNVGVQTCRDYLVDVVTQTEIIGKDASLQVNLLKTAPKVARWR